MPTLYLLCGKIGAGKSTLARRLASRPSTILISEDHWTSTLFADQLKTIEDYRRLSARLRAAMAPHIVDRVKEMLKIGGYTSEKPIPPEANESIESDTVSIAAKNEDKDG